MKWKKKVQNKKYRGRKIASAVCVLGVLAVCLGVIGYKGNLKAEETLPVMTRGVIDQINQIPETKRKMYDADADNYMHTLGTEDNPFFILEIVPYEEYATFGYHISGCEPVDPETNYGHASAMQLTNSLKTATAVQQNPAFFFEDEPEAKPDAYDENVIPKEYWSKNNEQYEGYYELVEDGKGAFRQNEDGSLYKDENGNIIWHTICKSEMEDMKAENSNLAFVEPDAEKKVLTTIGDRIYTKRVNTKDDPVLITYGYYYYKSNDDFIKYSLLMSKKDTEISDDAVKDYRIIIKTITPEELNVNPAWADYADLYVVSRSDYQGGTTAKVWKNYNKLGHTSNETEYKATPFVNTSTDQNRDITWDVVEKIFKKVTSDKIYAGMVMGSSVYSVESYTGATRPSTRMQLYDWNLKKIYNEVDGNYATVDSGTKCNANMYKLGLMLLSMDTDLFKDLYMKEGDDRLIKDGKFLMREGEDQEYWSKTTFLLMDSTDISALRNPYAYWTNEKIWENYGILVELSSYRGWVKGHVFSFNDDNTLTFDYSQASSRPNSKFTDYQDYLDDYFDGKDQGGTPADAVRFILGDRTKHSENITGKLNVLDIEPCYDSKNGYSLTENYIRYMIPKFRGTITITHMTTAEFIGKSEDLNSTYDMIYMGLDQGAYNTKSQNINGQNGIYTYWNDSNMNGKIYFHTGDKMTSAEYQKDNGTQKRSVKFLWSKNTNSVVNDTTLRFPGNDITKLKKAELEEYLAAGKPIVAVKKLYNNDQVVIDQYSTISKFITEQKKEDSSLYCMDDTASITNAIKDNSEKVTFEDGFPKEYNGSTASDDSVEIKNPNYLDRDSRGRSILTYKFTVNDTENKYSCRIYIDQNQDGKFEDDELYYTGKTFGNGEQTITLQLSKLYVGLVRWKIEVFQKKNENVRYVNEGCSAAKNITGTKKQVKVLQIVPDWETSNKGYLNLATSSTFKKYYKNLDDYEISIDVITADDFMKKFKGHKFSFDYSKEVDDTNPRDFTAEKYGKEVYNLWNNYNMYIIGFGDTYHKKNITNENGAVDFIKFFIASGKSVLFTHDLTSMHNTDSSDFGYAANTLLRDVMGMNRYAAISKNLSSSERTTLENYQSKLSYDTVTDINGNELEQKQGFTYFALKRLGWKKLGMDTSQKVPYQYMIKSAVSDKYVCGVGAAKETGFNNSNDVTTTVSQTNQGQITEYPYKIKKDFSIAPTHAQWYQLDMEDPEVTVWYCLSDDKKIPDFQDSDNSDVGTACTYDVSPNDAANNYYIYSKGNVFYSGVGHRTVEGDMEAKLFINTMIGAYRASYVPPVVEVLNPEAEITDMENLTYRMASAEEYNASASVTDKKVDISEEGDGEDSDEYIKIEFSPVELNAISTKLKCSIYYDDSNQFLKTIYHVTYDDDGNKGVEKLTAEEVTNADGSTEWQFNKNINHMDEYYFYYPKAYLNTWTDKDGVGHAALRNITFKVSNNKVKISGYTKLNMSVQSLFLLD